MLTVELPPGYGPERAYVLDVLLVAMLGLGYTTRVTDRQDVRITLASDPDSREVLIPDGLFATERQRWLTAQTLPATPLPWMARTDDPRAPSLPVLYGANGARRAIEATPAGLRLGLDVLGGAFFMLTRYEEMSATQHDEHERFPAHASLGARAGFLARPIVDEYVDLLWAALRTCWPGLQRRRFGYRVHLTHDVDEPFATVGVPVRTVLRNSAGDIVRRHDPLLAGRRMRSYVAARGGDVQFDPFSTFKFLMDVSERHGLHSAFYFMAAADSSAYAAPYRLDDPSIAALIGRIAARGHALGLHGSYDSLHEPARLRHEFELLRATADRLGVQQQTWGGRQHYLRWRNPASWRAWDHAGFDYDASVGFADQPGFRTGTCREHAVFDLGARRQLAIRERPLHVMDTTLFEYMKLTPPDAARLIALLAARCREHAGELFVLCHNSTLASARARDWYRSVVNAVSSIASTTITFLATGIAA